ncbi:MAG TPA: zf-HC2 domain-containing protein [Ktedonobacterales bacterium]|nr:zf-HC2 domain-containing protein [Ktedonobacterales bacterium]
MKPELTCLACRERLPEHVADHLAWDEREAVERHLAGCSACRREAALWSATAAALAAQDSRIPPDTRAEGGWLALRDLLPQRAMVTAQRRKADLMEFDVDSPTVDTRRAGATVADPRPPRRTSRRPSLALPAVVALVALLAALFGVFGAQLRRGTSSAVTGSGTPTPTACAPSALKATLPANAFISDISMTSPRDGWAVGQIGSPQQANAPHTLMMRFQNCQWQPYGDTFPAAELFGVSMVSATDGWAVGATVQDFTSAQANGATTHLWASDTLIALHYVDGQWRRVSLPEAPKAVEASVKVTPSGDGWILIDGGKSHTGPYTTKNAYTLLHYQGGVWTPTPLTFDTSGALILSRIAATSPNDCWIAGYGTAGDTFAVAHYHQGAWTTWSGPQLGVTYPALYAVTLTSPDDVWIAGSYPYKDANGDHTGPLALHYDGARWTRENIGDYGDQMGDHAIMALAAQSPTEVWAFPANFEVATYEIAHESGGAWKWVAVPPHTLSINAAVFVSDTEGFASAETPAPTGVQSVLLHYSNGAWSEIPAR